MSERILIIQMAKLGDFIQTTPLLANLRRKNSRAEIVVAAEQPAALAAAGLSPLVDAVFKIDDGLNSLEHLGGFSDILVLNSHPRAVGLAATVKAKNHYGPRLARDGINFTAAQTFLMALMRLRREAGRFNLVDVWTSLWPGSAPHPLVWPAVTPSELIPRGGEMKIGFQMGSRNHLRRWPVENFVRLAAELSGLKPGQAITPVLLGSSEERALGTKFEKMSAGQGLPRPLNLMGRTNLEELGRAVGGLDLLVTADTGVMHLAAAIGTPVLALFFGPAFGPETGPYGPGHFIYQASAPCAPCRESGDCRRRQCLEMPVPAIAARLAAGMIGQPNSPEAAGQKPALTLPAGHRIWRTKADSFGQSLRPLWRPVLTADEALTHLTTSAGRGVIRPDYQTVIPDLRELLNAYQRPDGPITVDGHFLSELARQGFGDDQPAREKFLATARELARTFGLEFA